MIQILFFGPVAEQVGVRELTLDFYSGLRLQDVIEQLEQRYADVLSWVSFIAVNNEQVRDKNMLLNAGDEIAFMAKFSGG